MKSGCGWCRLLLPAPRTPLPLPRPVHPLPWSRPAPSPCCPFLKHPSPGWPSLAYTCQTHQRLQASGQGRSCRRQEGCGALCGVTPSGRWASAGPVPTPSSRQSQPRGTSPTPSHLHGPGHPAHPRGVGLGRDPWGPGFLGAGWFVSIHLVHRTAGLLGARPAGLARPTRRRCLGPRAAPGTGVGGLEPPCRGR